MQRRHFLRSASTTLAFAGAGSLATAADPPARKAPQLKVSEKRRYLVEDEGKPFFVLADTPWFLQRLKIDDVRMVLEDRLKKGFNTLFLEILDDSRIPSVDGYGHGAFRPEKDITRPVEAYWKYADQVLEEVEKRGFFVIVSDLWYGAGAGLWMHHVTPINARIYGAFLGKRYARFKNLMWMHAGDRNPDKRLAECTRILAEEIRTAAPHQLHTVHNANEHASAEFYNEDSWLDVNLGYTYGASYLHVLPEYERQKPVRPVILGETGYENEPNAIELLPDARRGDLWTPYRIRRNAWWAVLCGACGYCAGSKLWLWENNWREVLHVRSIREAPHILTLMRALAWWKLSPDTKHRFLTSGYGTWKQANYTTASLAEDRSCGVVYLPSKRAITIDRSQLNPGSKASWFDPTNAALKPAEGQPRGEGKEEFTSPGPNAAKEADWVLVFK